jgi:hypothetical protein
MLLIVGCGNQGSPGNGNTVYMQTTIKQGSTGAVFVNVSGVRFSNRSTAVTVPNSMSFTIKSNVYPSTSKIPASDVDINSIGFSYTPVINQPGTVPPTFLPTVPSLPYSGNLPAGGTLNIDNVPILWNDDLTQIINSARTLGISNKTLQYKVDLTFHGKEVNTGVDLSNTINVSAFVTVK